jgi:alpha-beta hydrolase superfamily lysophospholipase
MPADGAACAGAVSDARPSDHRAEQPLWLPAQDGLRSFGVLHLPGPGTATGSAVLLCPPFGWEEESGHRGMAVWARALADAGHPTLRLELPGTRNSFGGVDVRTARHWRDAVTGAAGWLRERAGVARLTLLGIGLGGLVAVDALLEGAAIDDLILWGVPSKGRAAIRELRLQARLIAARFPDDPRPTGDDAPLETVGFVIGHAAVTEFEAITLTRPVPDPAGRRALLLGRDGIAADERLRAHLAQAGVDVTVADGPGWGDLTHDPQSSELPADTVAATVRWLAQAHLSPAEPAEPADPADDREPASTVEFEHEGVMLRERALRFPGLGGELFAVVTEPRDVSDGGLCAIMINSGSLSHVGPNRTSVEQARHWASAFGTTAVRFDLPGIGESEGDGERYRHNRAHYDRALVAETHALMDRHAELGLPSRFVVAGLCSGAYTALHVALEHERVAGALLLNLWAFFYSDELVAEREPGDALYRLRHEGVGRLLRRDVRPEKVIGAIRSIRPGRILAGRKRSIERAQVPEIVAALDRLRDAGIETLLMFGAGEPLFTQLESEGLLGRLGEWTNVTLERIPSRDHLYRTGALQRHVREHVDEALARVHARAGSSG